MLVIDVARLLDFPDEILANIVEAAYNTKEVQAIEISNTDGDWYVDADGISSVSSLSRTCRRLKNIAQPVLFRAVGVHCITTLAYMLATQPHLTRYIRGLFILSPSVKNDNNPIYITAAQVTAFNRAIKLFGIVNEDGTTPEVCEMSGTDEVDTFHEDHRLAGIFSTLVVAQCQRVERLVVLTRCFEILRVESSITFPRLVRIEKGHADTEMGTKLDLGWIIQAAPALTTICCSSIYSVESDIAHASLLKFEADFSCFHAEDIDRVMVSFPSLQRFSYSSGGHMVDDDDEPPPGYWMNALLKQKQSLRSLSLAWHEGGDYNFEYDDVPDLWRPFRDFKVLEELEITPILDGLGHDENDNQFLIKFLPTSIRKVSIMGHFSADCLLTFVKFVPERFPNLKWFEAFITQQDRLAEVVAAFEQHAVQFQVWQSAWDRQHPSSL